MGIFDQLASQLAVTATQGASQSLSRLATTGLTGLLQGVGILNPSNGLGSSRFNIDTFRTNLSAHGELARSDKFDVLFFLPQSIQFAPTSNTSQYKSGTYLQELTLQCEASELPSRDITPIEYRHYGFIKRIPHTNQYGQATFTFITSGDMWEKRLFDRWMDIMVPTFTGAVTYPLDNNGNKVYEAQMSINQYNMNGQLIYTAYLLDAIPVAVSPLGLDWSSDQPHKLTVTFNFRKWFSDSTFANVPPTDFGTAVGGNVTVPVASSPINNQTNNNVGNNLGIAGSVINGGINSLLSTSGQLTNIINRAL